MKRISVVAIVLTLLLPQVALAATYYISTSGSNSNPGTLVAPWRNLSKANTTLVAGDTVHIRSGTYAEQINPSNSGTSEGSRITYSAYGSESVTVGYATLTSKSYVTLSGLNFAEASDKWIYGISSSHITIENCAFYQRALQAGSGLSFSSSTYLRFIDNIVTPPESCSGGLAGCPADGLVLYDAHHALLEGNTFGTFAHGPIGGSRFHNCVIRGNTFSNSWHLNSGIFEPDGRNLYDSNISKFSGDNYTANPETESSRDNDDKSGIQTGACSASDFALIIRKSIFYKNYQGIFPTAYGLDKNLCNHRIYSNVIDGNYAEGLTPQAWSGATGADIVVKNNAITSNEMGLAGYVPGDTAHVFSYNNFYGNTTNLYKGTYASDSDIDNDFNGSFAAEFDGNVHVEPEYVDAAAYNYNLQSTSDLIDAGTWLTTITSATQGGGGATSFVVADASYFYDGWGIYGEAGDVIETANGQTTTITSINYGTNTITVGNPITWTQGEGLALSYNGTKPDIGALEYDSGGGDAPYRYCMKCMKSRVASRPALIMMNASGKTALEAVAADAGDRGESGGSPARDSALCTPHGRHHIRAGEASSRMARMRTGFRQSPSLSCRRQLNRSSSACTPLWSGATTACSRAPLKVERLRSRPRPRPTTR